VVSAIVDAEKESNKMYLEMRLSRGERSESSN